MTKLTITNGAGSTKTHEAPEVIATNRHGVVRLTALRRGGTAAALLASLEIPRHELYALLNVQPVKRAMRRPKPVSLRAKLATMGGE